MNSFKNPRFLLSFLATLLGLLLSFHLVGPSTALYRVIGVVLVVLSDLGIQAIKPSTPTLPPTGPTTPPAAGN